MNSLLILGVLASVALAVVVPPSRENAVECLMCEMAVKIAAPSAGQDTEEIEKKFDHDCKKALRIPFIDKKCEEYINTHLNPIIKELEAGTAPKDICTKVHGC